MTFWVSHSHLPSRSPYLDLFIRPLVQRNSGFTLPSNVKQNTPTQKKNQIKHPLFLMFRVNFFPLIPRWYI